MNQKQRILGDLRTIPWASWCTPDGVCGSFWLEARLPRYAARIHELRQAGYKIETGWCKTHKTATYRLADDE